MSDRATLTLNYLKKDEGIIVKAIGYEPNETYEDDKYPETLQSIFFEMGGAGWNELKVLSDEHPEVVYTAFGDAGIEYGPSSTASDGVEREDTECDFDGYPCVRVEPNGKINEYELKEARRYLRIFRNAEAILYPGKEG